MGEWKRAALGNLVETGRSITYGVVKPGPTVEGGVTFVRGGDIVDGKILVEQLRTIAPSLSESYRRTILRGGELVVSLVGNPGEPAIVPTSLKGANIARQVGLVPLDDSVNPCFVYYYLRSPIGQQQLSLYKKGSVQIVINLGDLKLVEVRLPERRMQGRIVSVLAAYDDLIENNTKRIVVLGEMARVFWSQWKSSAASSAPVGSLVRLIRDQVDPSSVDPETPYIGLEHIPRRSLDLSERGRASDAVSAKTAFVRWDIIFGKIRPYFHKVGPAAFDGISSNDAVVMRVRQEDDFAAVLMCVTSDEFVAEISQKANGSKMPRADWGDMAAYEAPCGSPEDRAALNRAVRPMVEMIQNLGERNRALRAARDLLLPKLLSGELSVDRIPDPAEVAP